MPSFFPQLENTCFLTQEKTKHLHKTVDYFRTISVFISAQSSIQNLTLEAQGVEMGHGNEFLRMGLEALHFSGKQQSSSVLSEATW